MNLAVVFGGKSSEHDVSVITGVMTVNAAAARHRPAAAIHRKALGMILCFILQSFWELHKFHLPIFFRTVFAVVDVGLVA